MMKLLIVGGTGFIGYNVALKAKKDFEVIVLSSKECPKERHIKDVKYITTNLRNFDDLHDELSKISIDYVINLGGYVNHSDFFSGGDSVIRVHFAGLFNLIKCLDKDNLKGFVQIGSGDEYGLSEAPQVESQRENPSSSYAFAKTAANHFIQMLHKESNLPMVGLRIFLTYGPGQDDNRFIPQIIKGCFANKEFATSKGKQLRDFCYIDDIVTGILSALTCSDAHGKIINLASGNPIQIKEVITIIQKQCAGGFPLFGKIKYRKNENMELYADVKLAKNILNWESKTDIMTGIKKTIAEYCKEK